MNYYSNKNKLIGQQKFSLLFEIIFLIIWNIFGIVVISK